MVNLGAPLRVQVTAAGERTLLAEIVRLVEAAEQGRSRFVALADRVARALCAGRPCHGAAHLPRLDAAGRPRLGPRPGDRDRRADHHLSLRAGPRRSGRAGRRQRPPAAPRRAAAVADRSGAAGGSRPCRARQDRHADAGTPRTGRGRRRRRGAGRRRRPRRHLAPSAGPGAAPRRPRRGAGRWRARAARRRPAARRHAAGIGALLRHRRRRGRWPVGAVVQPPGPPAGPVRLRRSASARCPADDRRPARPRPDRRTPVGRPAGGRRPRRGRCRPRPVARRDLAGRQGARGWPGSRPRVAAC